MDIVQRSSSFEFTSPATAASRSTRPPIGATDGKMKPPFKLHRCRFKARPATIAGQQTFVKVDVSRDDGVEAESLADHAGTARGQFESAPAILEQGQYG